MTSSDSNQSFKQIVSQIGNINRYSDSLPIWSHIPSNLLNKWILESSFNSNLLIIDTRDTTEFNKLHIKNSFNIQLSKIVYQQLKTDKISINEILLKNTNIDLLSNSTNDLNIVVYDQKSEHSNQLDFEKSFIILLLKKLSQKYKSVSFLIGGFLNFNLAYPNVCVSASLNNTRNENLIPILVNSQLKEENTILNLKPKQFRFNHSLSTYGIDLCPNSSSNSTLSSQSSIHSETNNFNHVDQVKLNINYLASPQEQPVGEPTKILDFLYLGSQEDALSKSTMEALNITCVLNVSITCPKPEFIKDANFLRISVNDGHTAKLLPFFDIAFKFIEKCRKLNCKVLIHCLAGISRSPSLAIAYLMKHLNLGSDEAYKFVKERRKTISPNFNFLGQLYEYEKQLQITLINNKSKETTKQEETTNENIVETRVDSPSLAFLKFEKKTFKNNCETTLNGPSSLVLNSTHKKQFIFNFSSSNNSCSSSSSSSLKTSSVSLLSPSQAFSSFTLNSPTIEQHQQHQQQQQQQFNNKNVIKSLTCNSFQEILTSTTTSSQVQQTQKPNVVMRRPTNLLIERPSSLVNNLKRPSSILLNTNIKTSYESDNQCLPNEQNQTNCLTRTLSAGSSSSSSSCSTTCSNHSCSSSCNQVQSQNQLDQYQFQKKIKLSPIQDRIVLNSFNQLEKSFDQTESNNNNNNNNSKLNFFNNLSSPVNLITSPLTPNSLINTNNIILSFNQKMSNESKQKVNKILLKDDLHSEEEDEENEENNANLKSTPAIANSNSNKSSSSSSSSNKNSLHGSIETMIEVS